MCRCEQWIDLCLYVATECAHKGALLLCKNDSFAAVTIFCLYVNYIRSRFRGVTLCCTVPPTILLFFPAVVKKQNY
jgi:hypothetical protein